jgi:SAM-dependent methyltransferase
MTGEARPLKSRSGLDYWDEVGREFSTGMRQRFWREHADRVNEALFERWRRPGGYRAVLKTDLFDEAVSHGLYPALARHSPRVAGTDISDETVTAAQQKYPGLEAMQGDVRRLPWSDEEFDLVISNSTLDHFEDERSIEASLAEIFRVLRPGGECMVSMDNRQNPLIHLRGVLPFPLLKSLRLVPYYVGRTYTLAELTRAMAGAGFTTVESAAIMHCPRFAAVPLAELLGRVAPGALRGFLSLLARMESLEKWPTARLTAHFVAVKGVKP